MDINIILKQTVNEVLEDAFNFRKDVCRCEECVKKVRGLAIEKLSIKYNNLSDDKHIRVQGVDAQMRVDAAREIFHILNQMKPNH